jgi:hypothetical protein
MQTNDSDSPPGMKSFWGPGRTWEDNPKIDLRELDVRMWAGLFRPARGPAAGSFCARLVNN